MKDKVLALAKGNFIYETPGLIVEPAMLDFEVVAGEREQRTFSLTNTNGSKIKGIGSTEDLNIEFLPVFNSDNNELIFEVDATELVPGEVLEGALHLVTDCGQIDLPYKINIVVPKVEDDDGVIDNYYVFKERIIEDAQQGAAIFCSKEFKQNFLYRDERGKKLYNHLTKNDSTLQSMEEFLVASGKKEPLRFLVDHKSINDEVIVYELNGVDIQDSFKIKLNTWGIMEIKVKSTVNFLELDTDVMKTERFVNGSDILVFKVLAEKVWGRSFGSIILESPYEKKEIKICAHNIIDEQNRKVQRAKREVFDTLFRTYLACEEKTVTVNEYVRLLSKNRSVIEKLIPDYSIPLRGYIACMLNDKEQMLNFYRESSFMEMPNVGDSNEVVYNYILMKYINYLFSQNDKTEEEIVELINYFWENGYACSELFYLKCKADSKYKSETILLRELREQLEQGYEGRLLYSMLMRLYVKNPDLVSTLDRYTLKTLSYGLKANLITEEIAVNFNFLAERFTEYEPFLFSIMEKFYLLYPSDELLQAICTVLIRNEKLDKKYFKWYALGVERHLRVTDLYEYYMYTMDRDTERLLGTDLPESVVSYFQYENHLNDSANAYLYAYIVRKRDEREDYFAMYANSIREFAINQLKQNNITIDNAYIFTELYNIATITDEIALLLPYVMYSHQVVCDNPKIEGVIVSHIETKEEKYYPLENGVAMVSIYTPNYLLFFVDNEGKHYSETIDYRITKLVNFEKYTLNCYEKGSTHPYLMANLAVMAIRGITLRDIQIQIIEEAMQMDIFTTRHYVKMQLALYDYAKDKKDMDLLLRVLDSIDPDNIKRERIGDIATQCIYHGMYDKANAMLLRYGITGCEKKALAMLLQDKMLKSNGEFEPVYVKWCMFLYRQNYMERSVLMYLLQFYIGPTEILTEIYERCLMMPDVTIRDSDMERLLGQVLFTNQDLTKYEKLILEYYEKGTNRVLVKALIAASAYNYVVDREEVLESIFSKIEKEAYYEKEQIMILATLKYYSTQNTFTRRQTDFIERQLEKAAEDGKVMNFMRDYIGKINVPYEIENAVIIQYFSGSKKGVFLFLENDEGTYDSEPMEEVLDGVFTVKLLLFEDEKRKGYILDEETGVKTDTLIFKHTKHTESQSGFFQMVNQMILAQRNGNDFQYDKLREQYEQSREAAKNLFVIY